jgi:hypothetical protein
LPLPGSGWYNILLPWMIEHQVLLNAFTCLSECGQSDCGISHLGVGPSVIMYGVIWEHCTFDCEIFSCVKICYPNSIIIINFM